MLPAMAASGRLAEIGMMLFCGVTIVGVSPLRARSSSSSAAETDLASGMSVAEDTAGACERDDPGRMESELVLGFGGGGMARLEIASASAGVDSGASGTEGELFEASKGRGAEGSLMAGSLSCEGAMSGNVARER